MLWRVISSVGIQNFTLNESKCEIVSNKVYLKYAFIEYGLNSCCPIPRKIPENFVIWKYFIIFHSNEAKNKLYISIDEKWKGKFIMVSRDERKVPVKRFFSFERFITIIIKNKPSSKNFQGFFFQNSFFYFQFDSNLQIDFNYTKFLNLNWMRFWFLWLLLPVISFLQQINFKLHSQSNI